jgi:hypothetical protein
MEKSYFKELDYGISIAVMTLVQAMGMHAENQQRIHRGASLAYTEQDFNKLLDKNGVHHSGVLTRWESL